MIGHSDQELNRKFVDLVKNISGEEPCVKAGDNELYSSDWTQAIGASKRVAEEMCAGCPLLEMCRDYAMAAKEPIGIWGGTRPSDRGYKRPRKKKTI